MMLEGAMVLKPLNNDHLLTIEHVTFKVDDPANTIAVKGFKAVTDSISNSKHLYLQGATRPAGIIYQIFVWVSSLFYIIYGKFSRKVFYFFALATSSTKVRSHSGHMAGNWYTMPVPQ
tara:strand:+ start:805 stop:1158 length:354 start_codon:yes stop_codon:yes gene_type:complete